MVVGTIIHILCLALCQPLGIDPENYMIVVLYSVQTGILFSSTSSLCWHGCVQKGNLIHMLWACKHLTSYWCKIFQFISDLSGFLVFPNLPLAILYSGIDDFPTDYCTIVTHVFLATRITILRH